MQAGPLLGILTWALEFGFSLKCWRSMGHQGGMAIRRGGAIM